MRNRLGVSSHHRQAPNVRRRARVTDSPPPVPLNVASPDCAEEFFAGFDPAFTHILVEASSLELVEAGGPEPWPPLAKQIAGCPPDRSGGQPACA